MIRDAFDIGWWIESGDEEIHGPVSRETLRQFVSEGVISTNTLVRHCTQAEYRPVADQPGVMDGIEVAADAPATGDRLADAWPRRNRDRLELAEADLPCARHRRPAVLVCTRCHATYCNKCRARPFKRQFYVCKKCLANLYNRRIFAYIFDVITLFLPLYGAGFALGVAGAPAGPARIASMYIASFVAGIILHFRDPLCRGASPGKRIAGLRVVSAKDGVTPVSYGQTFVRNLSLAIPYFNLVDASVAYRDPLGRRFGDRWAKTLVIEVRGKVDKLRGRVQNWLTKKGVELQPIPELTPEQLARSVE